MALTFIWFFYSEPCGSKNTPHMGIFKNMILRAAIRAGLPVFYERTGIINTMGREAKVDASFALKIAAVWSCVDLLAGTMSTLPLHVKERTASGRRMLYDHPVARLMLKPNPKMNGVAFRRAMMASVCLHGNAYAIITQRDMRQRPTRLDFVLPQNVSLWEGDDDLFYSVTGNDARIPSRDVIHLKGMSTNGLTGLSPIRQHAELLETSHNSLNFARAFYENGCRPTGVFKHSGSLSDEARERLKNDLAKKYAGLRNFAKPLLLESGLDFSPVTIPPEDAQFVATRLQSIDEIAAIFRVPPHMVGNQSHSTYSNNEQQNLELYNLNLRPWIVNFEAEFNDKLFLEEEKGSTYVDIDAKGLLRADTAARTAFYEKMYYIGAMNANEIRACEDLDGYDKGDQFYHQANMTPVDDNTKKNGTE